MAWRPPPAQSASEWADAERKLSPESSASPGQWETSRAEYQREFMDACSNPKIPEVIGIFASQTGKSDSILNVMAQRIHRNPGPMLAIYPTLEIAEAFSKDRVRPMIRDTPALAGIFGDVKTRDSAQTIRHITFRGGHLTMAGANSPASLASRPIRDLFADEIDRYPQSAGAEGNPLKLATTRTAGFWNAKKIYITSPGNKGSSLSEPIWEKSDQRRYFVPCYACGTFQTLRWPQVQWDKTQVDGERRHLTETARYVCESCGIWWSDGQRQAAVRRGQWRATAEYRGVAGFHLNALAAPWESRRLSVLAEQWVEAQRNPELLRVFFTTVLAEWYEQKYTSLKTEAVEARCEPYPRREADVVAPWGVAIITAGVDVQGDRIEVQIQGYGAGQEQWKLQYHVLKGDPSAPAVWDELWTLLLKPIPMARGGVDFIRATCVDTGAHSLRAYDFCRPRFAYQPDRRKAYVFAIKGKGGAGGEFWPRQPTLKNKGRIPLYLVRVDHAKEILYASLDKITTAGAGYIHFPGEVTTGEPFNTRYFNQLTAEQVTDERASNGTIERVWRLKSEGRRNEALDTSVYGEAALRGLISLGLDLNQEAADIARLYPAPVQPTEPGAPLPPPPPPAPHRRKRRRSTSQFLQRGR